MEDPLEIIALGVGRIEADAAKFQTEVKTLFDGLETRFDGLETKVDRIENKVDRGFERVQSCLDRHEVRIEALEEKTK
jgi:hypothetical protein